MPKFSRKSKKILNTCDERLVILFDEVVKIVDCKPTCGYRGESEQNLLFTNDVSKVVFPFSKHNIYPSQAVDIYPFIKGKGVSFDSRQCYFFAGFVWGIARQIGIKIRLGADWDSDGEVNDQTFRDICHFELV